MQPSQTFHDHIRELRKRLAYALVALGITSSLSYYFRNPIIKFIQKPLHSVLYFTSPAGSFNFVIKIATTVGVFTALPIIVYNLVKFIEPALPKNITRKQITKITTASFILATIGVAFGYFVIVPMSLHFFLSYSTSVVKPLITANEYLSFILNVLITFALIFQIPLIFLFINFVKPLKPRNLLRYQKYVVISSLVIAVLLPFTYDPISQLVLALPIVACFYASVILIYFVNRKNNAFEKSKTDTNSRVNTRKLKEAQVIEVPGKLTKLVLQASISKNEPLLEKKARPKRSIYIDGFINSKPSNPLIGFKTLDVLPIAEYRARNSIKKNGDKGLSIDGFKFAS